MEEILKKRHYRKVFYAIIGLILVLTILIRVFVIPYFDQCLSITWSEVFVMLLDGLFASLIVTVFIGMFIFWITPEIVKKSVMDVIDPKEISPLLKQATHKSRSWIFKGVGGRYTRNVTLPAMADAARSEGIGRDIRICLINPANEKLCREYATYRKSLKSADKSDPWDYQKVRHEVVSTIVSALITQHDEPLLRIEIFLLEHFSAFRLDISDNYVVITKEDKEAAGLKADQGTYFYDSYKDEVRLHERQAKRVVVDSSTDYLNRQSFTDDELKCFIQNIKILDNEIIDTLDFSKIATSIRTLKNPYA